MSAPYLRLVTWAPRPDEHSRRHRLACLFALVAPYCFDAEAGRKVGLGGLRSGPGSECNRPMLWPRMVEDPVRHYDWVYEGGNRVFSDRRLYGTRERRRAIRAGNAEQRLRLLESVRYRRRAHASP